MQKLNGTQASLPTTVPTTDTYYCNSVKIDPRVQETFKRISEASIEREIEDLHSQGISLRGTDKYGRSVMTMAALYGNADLLNTLKKLGCNIHESNQQRWTPLLAATFNSQHHILPHIIALGANIDHQSQDGSTALFLATSNQDLPSFLYLLSQNANPLLETKIGNTALKQAVRNKDMSMIVPLTEKGAHPQTKDRTKQENAFMVAAEVGFLEALQYFATRGGDLDDQDKCGSTALTKTILKNKLNCLQWLIDQGVNINLLNPRGESPLALAARLRRYDAVRILIDNNADISDLPRVLDKARGMRVIDYLNSLNQSITIHFPAEPSLQTRNKHLKENFHNFIEIQGIDINQCQINGEHPLIWTVSHGFLKETKYLLDHGVSAQTRDSKGNSAMHYAILAEDFPMVQCLVRGGAIISEEDIHIAESKYLSDIAKYLKDSRP